ncbi:MAG: transporter, partial [Saprospiraceae bacterium]|nr:transporter [Saprospiraceae bacterium]
MKKILGLGLCAMLYFCLPNETNAQGCVAIRNMSCSSSMPNTGTALTLFNPGEFQLQLGYRHFRSFRHFRGDHEEANRVADGTEVINMFNSVDFGLSYALNGRWSLSATLPYITNDRTSLYEHYGNSLSSNPEQKRFHTQSAGIGDLRIGA